PLDAVQAGLDAEAHPGHAVLPRVFVSLRRVARGRGPMLDVGGWVWEAQVRCMRPIARGHRIAGALLGAQIQEIEKKLDTPKPPAGALPLHPAVRAAARGGAGGRTWEVGGAACSR